MIKKRLIHVCLVALLPIGIIAQEPIVVTGVVSDEVGVPLLGANVFVLDWPYGSSTEADGVYRFTVPQSLLDQEILLRASFIGYRSKTVKLTLQRGQNEQKFSLAIDVLKSEEMIITSMGVGVTRDKLGVTIGKVSPREIVNSDEINVVSALSGKVSNIEVTSSSGEPGAGAYIRIRGINSIAAGTQPLFVVDGSPINNQSIFNANRRLDVAVDGVTQQNRASDLNPQDIASIDVLKGAAASAMYGSRAANGVVLITTKNGVPGRTRATYRLSYTFDEVNKTVPLQRKYGQGTGGEFDANVTGSWGPDLEVAGTPTYDHANEVFGTGHKIDNSFSIAGGSDKTSYYLSLGRTDIGGVIKGNSDYDRNTVRLKASHTVTDQLYITGNISIATVESNRIQKGSNVSGLLLGALRTPPEFNNQPYIEPETGFHRSYQTPTPITLAGSRGFDNPFFVLYEHTNLSEVNRFFGNTRIDYDFRPWLNISYTLGYDFSDDQRRTVFPLGTSQFPDGRIIRDEFTSRETDGNLVVTAVRHFAPAAMHLTLMAGQNLNERDIRTFTTQGDGIAVDGFDQLGSAASFLTVERQEIVRIEGYFAQALVDLWDQFYLTAGLRNDGASVFSNGKKRHWYPKISSSWNFTELNALSGKKWLNFGKVRAAYGETGRLPAPYATITGFITDTIESDWGDQLSTTAYGYGGFISDPTRGQEDIKPERAKEFETGFDLGLLDNRLGLDITYYNQKTTDVIYSLPQAPSTGFRSQIRNAGTITNKGIELGLNTRLVNRQDVRWGFDLTYARNRNNVTELPGTDFLVLGPFDGAPFGGSVVEGHAVGVHRGPDYVRFGRGSAVDGVFIDEAFTGWKSDDLYISESGYPIVDPEIRILSDPNPDWTGGLRNTFTFFNNLQFTTLFDIKNGGDMWNGTKGALYFYGTHKDTEDREGTQVFEGVGPGQGTPVSKGQEWYAVQPGSLFTGVDSPFVEDGGYVKLREIAVSYTLRHGWVEQRGLSAIDLRLSARNLKTWTDYTGIDPEANVTGTSNLRGQDYFNNPQTRSYAFTVQINY